jgi:hypothetical protein
MCRSMCRVAAVSLFAPAVERRLSSWFRRAAIAAATIALMLAGMACAQASVVITVNKSTQRLSVSVNGQPRYRWPVSTARRGYATPNGTYRPERLARKWYSRKYDWSPMPYSIFYHGGFAIHGSYEISHLGRPASHGCIRLHPKNAAVLFRLVKRNRGDTRIVVTGQRPSYRTVRKHPRSRRVYRRAPSRYAPSRYARGRTYERVFIAPPDYFYYGR